MDIKQTIRTSRFDLVKPYHGLLMLFNEIKDEYEHGEFTLLDPGKDIYEALVELLDNVIITVFEEGNNPLENTIYRIIREDCR